VNNTNWRKRCKFVSHFLFNNNYDLPELTTDTKSPYKLLYVWLSIFTLFVLKRGWKRYSPQIIFVCFSTWSIVEVKNRFETLITRNVLNGVSLFQPSCWITPMAYLCSQGTPNVQIKYFMYDLSIYRLFVLIRAGNVILSKWWYS
jgi:hypothetical protein